MRLTDLPKAVGDEAVKPQIGTVIVVMLVAGLIGAFGLYSIFILIWPVARDAISVRLCLGVVMCFLVAFGWTALRISRDQPPLNVSIPPRLNPAPLFRLPENEGPWVTGILAFLVAYLIATTVWR